MEGDIGIDFRVILITSGRDPRPLVERVSGLSTRPIGIMLRPEAADTETAQRVLHEMISLLQRSGLPENVVPIVNLVHPDLSAPEGWWSHLPSRVLLSGQRPTGNFGAAAHSVGELRAAARAGAMYATLSPVYPTPSKPGHPGIGSVRFAELSKMTTTPLLALGGIDSGERLSEVMRAGAAGFASIRAGTAAYLDRLREMLAIIEEETAGYKQRTGGER